MLVQPTRWNRWANSLVGVIPVAGFLPGAISALISPHGPAVVAIGGLLLVVAFTALGVRGFRMRVETTPDHMIVHGMPRTRTISRPAIVSIGPAWTYTAAPAIAYGGVAPSVRWRAMDGKIRTTPIWCLIYGGREPSAWRRHKERSMRQLQDWAPSDERHKLR